MAPQQVQLRIQTGPSQPFCPLDLVASMRTHAHSQTRSPSWSGDGLSLLPVQRPGQSKPPWARAGQSRKDNSPVVPILAAETDQFSPDFQISWIHLFKSFPSASEAVNDVSFFTRPELVLKWS